MRESPDEKLWLSE